MICAINKEFYQHEHPCSVIRARLAPVVFVLYLFLSFSTLFFFIMILFNPTSSYLWLNKTFLSSQGTIVNKNSTSYTSVVSPQKKRRERKKRKIKKGSGGQTKSGHALGIFRLTERYRTGTDK